MPEGSSSEAPVMRPGPRRRRRGKSLNARRFLLASTAAVRVAEEDMGAHVFAKAGPAGGSFDRYLGRWEVRRGGGGGRRFLGGRRSGVGGRSCRCRGR